MLTLPSIRKWTGRREAAPQADPLDIPACVSRPAAPSLRRIDRSGAAGTSSRNLLRERREEKTESLGRRRRRFELDWLDAQKAPFASCQASPRCGAPPLKRAQG